MNPCAHACAHIARPRVRAEDCPRDSRLSSRYSCAQRMGCIRHLRAFIRRLFARSSAPVAREIFTNASWYSLTCVRVCVCVRECVRACAVLRMHARAHAQPGRAHVRSKHACARRAQCSVCSAPRCMYPVAHVSRGACIQWRTYPVAHVSSGARIPWRMYPVAHVSRGARSRRGLRAAAAPAHAGVRATV